MDYNTFLPTDFINRMEQDLGPAFHAFLRSYDENKICALRFNALKAHGDATEKLNGIISDRVEWSPNGYYYNEEYFPIKDMNRTLEDENIKEFCLFVVDSQIQKGKLHHAFDNYIFYSDFFYGENIKKEEEKKEDKGEEWETIPNTNKEENNTKTDEPSTNINTTNIENISTENKEIKTNSEESKENKKEESKESEEKEESKESEEKEGYSTL